MNSKDDTLPTAPSASSGVQALIERLRAEGVAAGQEQAARLVTDAEHRAEWILRQAEEQAERTRAEAEAEAERLRLAGEAALRVAVRDAVLALKSALTLRFTEEVRGLVGARLSEAEMIDRLIVAVAARARDDAGMDDAASLEIVLPRDVAGLDQLRQDPEALSGGSLGGIVLTVAEDMLRDGVRVSLAEDESKGIRVRLNGGAVEIDLTDKAVAEVLLSHLQPRFRAMLEGVVK